MPHAALPTPTVFLVDDDLAVLDSMSELIATMQFQVQAFSSGEEFLQAYSIDSHGCLLLDLRMPQMGGLEVQQALLQAKYWLPIIFMTAHGDATAAVRAMKAGAIDFLQKPFSYQDLWESIQQAIQIDASVRNDRRQQDQFRSRLLSLTSGERDVLDLLVEGLINKQIAARLDVSLRTVEARRSRIFLKMQVESLGQLLALFHRRQAQRVRDPHALAPTMSHLRLSAGLS